MWVGGPLLVFMPLASRVSHPNVSPLWPLGRWCVATGYWFLMTQWCFGRSLLDRVHHHTGSCDLGDHVSSAKDCLRNGGSWSGLDISGHCL